MKLFFKILFLFTVFITVACSDDDNPVEPETEAGVSVTVNDLFAANGSSKTYFRFSDSTEVTGSDTLTNKWDIAFNRTSIYTNSGSSGTGSGGAVVMTGTDFIDLKTAPESGYNVDTDTLKAIPTGSGNGWYNYSGPPNHVISPIPGVVLVIKTGDGKYSKVQITSYYQGSPENPGLTDPSGYYSFKYFYQPDGSRNLE